MVQPLDIVEEEKKKEESFVDLVQKTLNLDLPSEFDQNLKEKFKRPFLFGPVDFTDLNQSFE